MFSFEIFDRFSAAPGCRNRNTGILNDGGRYGYSWISSTNSTLGLSLHFSVDWIGSSLANSRGYGLQLRCLSE
ncbi:hypothetical protein [uncultured Rikenella sp.]|uniref:hypothetical protein n=1 Tax=uncultured Rikenella sp. TaxID=368003 RepID=UPI002602969D|nr:hypothetical protein [uncultured Rikenella sp.]